jgi:hypothetical protein
MIFSNDRTTKDALLNTLGDELAAAWVRFYAIEVDSRLGELDRRGVLMAHAADWRRRGSDFRKAPGGRGALARARVATR